MGLVKVVQKESKKIFYPNKMRASQSDCILVSNLYVVLRTVPYCTVLYCIMKASYFVTVVCDDDL